MHLPTAVLIWYALLAGQCLAALLISQRGALSQALTAQAARIAIIPALWVTGLLLTHGTISQWIVPTFIAWLGFFVMHFSLQFLSGDAQKAHALAWMQVLVVGSALTWQVSDGRGFLLALAMTLVASVRLIGLERDWPAARAASRLAALSLGSAWLAAASVITILAWQTSSWQTPSIAQWQAVASPQMTHALAFAVLLAVVLSAAQWPAQRWLMSSLVAPTPVSAILHAGVVNVAAVMLWHWSHLLSGSAWLGLVLGVIAVVSIILGGGMSLVQVDVKRRLAASTVAQMGCMILQCVIGAYTAALVHLVLHACFKATHFLHASHLKNLAPAPVFSAQAMALNTAAGLVVLALGMALNASSTILLSSLLLTSAVLAALQQISWQYPLRAAGYFVLPALLVAMYLAGLFELGGGGSALVSGPQTIALLLMLIVGSALLALAQRNLASPSPKRLSMRLYAHLVAAAEAPANSIDPHPSHRTQRFHLGDAQ